MIRNPELYRQQAEQERWEALRRMTVDESIAIGEALLTSEIMRFAQFPADDRPRNLASALGIAPRSAGIQDGCSETTRGRK
jgi:hypothetical protein